MPLWVNSQSAFWVCFTCSISSPLPIRGEVDEKRLCKRNPEKQWIARASPALYDLNFKKRGAAWGFFDSYIAKTKKS